VIPRPPRPAARSVRRTAPRAAAIALSVALAGCAAFRAAPPPEPAEPVPIAAADPILATLVEGWAGVVDERRALRGGMVMKLAGPGGERRLSQNLVLARPGRIRMEIQAFLTTAAVLVADGARYDYFESVGHYRERGPVHPHLLWQIAGVPLTLDQAVSFLLGGPPRRAGLRPAGGAHEPDGSIRVDLADARGRRVRSLRFDPEGPLVHAEEWGPDERLRWAVGYDRYREVGGEPFAHAIDFDFPRYESRATVAFRTVELNPETPDAVFELGLPDDDGGAE
jgi:hypothetical protein